MRTRLQPCAAHMQLARMAWVKRQLGRLQPWVDALSRWYFEHQLTQREMLVLQ